MSTRRIKLQLTPGMGAPRVDFDEARYRRDSEAADKGNREPALGQISG